MNVSCEFDTNPFLHEEKSISFWIHRYFIRIFNENVPLPLIIILA